MLNGLINWFRRRTDFLFPKLDFVEAQGTVAPSSNNNRTYLIDASAPELTVDKPLVTTPILPMRALGETTGGQPMGTIPQQAAGLKQMVNDALLFMTSKTVRKITRWAATGSLNLQPRAGQEANAYYDRSGLKFFFFPDNFKKRNIYTCDSRAVVTHEFGHAYLDILRPDLWSAQSAEVWAFHEAFGDMTALLASLQYDALISKALIETGGDLTKSNCLSRLAVDMGQGIYNLTGGKYGEDPNCLRDLSIRFNYTKPELLPTKGRDDQLINECHSFSRVFSGMFYRLIVGMMEQNKKAGMTPKDALLTSRDAAAAYLIQATSTAPMNSTFFSAVCQEMLINDRKAGSKYQKVMLAEFQGCKILKPTVKMLTDTPMKYDDLVKNISDQYDVEEFDGGKIVRTLNTKTVRLVEKFGVTAMSNNPLLNLRIELAAQSAFYFNEKDELENAEEGIQTDALNAAFECVKMIHDQNLADGSETALFEIQDDKLVRKQIKCGCNKPNYCIPGSPEYQKPWKPANNGGCVSCKHTNCQPRSCDCAQPEPAPAPKIGCYTTINSNGITSYKVGSRTSRRVC